MTPPPEPIDHYRQPVGEYDGFPVFRGIAIGVSISLVFWVVAYESGRAWGLW